MSSGLDKLSASDLLAIALTPDLMDLLSDEGRKQIGAILADLIASDPWWLFDRCVDVQDEIETFWWLLGDQKTDRVHDLIEEHQRIEDAKTGGSGQ